MSARPRNSKSTKIEKWFWFTFIITIVPIAATYFIPMFFNKSITLVQVISHGELHLIAIALLVDGLGNLWYGKAESIYKRSLSGIALIIISMLSIWYGGIISASILQITIDCYALPTVTSLTASIIISLGCVVVS